MMRPTRRNSLSRRFEDLVDRLAAEPVNYRTAAAVLAGYALLWWIYALIAKSTQDIHFDMGEIFSWSTELAWGYPKHPPFPAWIAALWFSVFPRTDAAYYLLSVTSITAALWFIWLIATRLVNGPNRAVALLLLTFSPLFNFHPLKFNHNSMLILTWAFATWAFLRSYFKPTFGNAVCAGAAAAIAMLTKYWSAFLILGLVAGALTGPKRRDYLRSPAPWISTSIGSLLLAPNIAAVFASNFQPLKYAVDAHHSTNFTLLWSGIVSYVSGVVFLLLPMLVIQLAARPGWQQWREMLWPGDAVRRLFAIILFTSFLSPIVVGLLLNMRLHNLWSMSPWALLPALLLSAPAVNLSRQTAARIVAGSFIFSLVAVLASPVVALVRLRQPPDTLSGYCSLVAREVDRSWSRTSSRPLEFVAGPSELAWGCTFYCRDLPRAFPDFSRISAPWIDPEAMIKHGFVAVCPQEMEACRALGSSLASRNPSSHTDTINIVRSFYGLRGKPRQFTIVVVPPGEKTLKTEN